MAIVQTIVINKYCNLYHKKYIAINISHFYTIDVVLKFKHLFAVLRILEVGDLKRKFSFVITIAFILIDVVAAFLTQQAIISNLMGILIGVGLIIALILITSLIRRLKLSRGKLVLATLFFFLVIGHVVMATLPIY
ncbi:hypothetical protein [Companilactobacillus bobalius]|uniref:hypothetical protein n=1 Tax=Companilactobacillus bobalius TaxID=2801451 RepID=UPI0007048CD6|nr:hypothetical protein [Companilactobacillus bobalius]KAE9558420.1 hypothetical protein ATN92_13585 [Companilactobacillus bobalius]